MGKIADGIYSGRYGHLEQISNSVPSSSPTNHDSHTSHTIEMGKPEKRQEGVAPRMFKALIGKGNPEFESVRQQVNIL